MRSPKVGTAPRRRGPNLVTPEPAPTLGFNNDLFMSRTTELGCQNVEERATVAGISRSALMRLRRGEVDLSLARARAMAHMLDVSVDDLFPARTPTRTSKRRAA
jgi:transcriptional regulator with XRE-family HTH domain